MRRAYMIIFCLWLLCVSVDGQKKKASKKVKKPSTDTSLCKKADINQLSGLFSSLLRNEVADMRNDVQSELSHMHEANMDVRDELFEIKEKIAALAKGGRCENITMPDTPCNMSFPNHETIESWIKEAVEDQMNSFFQAISSKIDIQPPDKQGDCLVSGTSTGSCSGEKDGIFTIRSRNDESFLAKCNKGWLVLAHRYDGSVDFNRDWQDYKNGFGNLTCLTGEFFLGMDKIVSLTNSENYTARFELTSWDNDTRASDYSSFKVASETENYRLTIGGFKGKPGNAGDGMTSNNGLPFSTKDRDHDTMNDGICPYVRRGPWWHRGCGVTDLFSKYWHKTRCDIKYGCLSWYKWPKALYEGNNGWYSFRAIKIMIRPSTE